MPEITEKEIEKYLMEHPEIAYRVLSKRELKKSGNRSFKRKVEDPVSEIDSKTVSEEARREIERSRRELLKLAGLGVSAGLLGLLGGREWGFREALAQSQQVTIEPNSFVIPASYVVFGDDLDNDGILDIIYARNGRTGQIDYKGNDASTIIQNAIDSLNSEGKVFIISGSYDIYTSINISDWCSLSIEGESMGYMGSYSTRFLIRNNIPLFNVLGKNHSLIIKNLYIDGLGVGTSLISAPSSADNLSGLIIENVGVANFNGILIDNPYGGEKIFVKNLVVYSVWTDVTKVIRIKGGSVFLENFDVTVNRGNISAVIELSGTNTLLIGGGVTVKDFATVTDIYYIDTQEILIINPRIEVMVPVTRGFNVISSTGKEYATIIGALLYRNKGVNPDADITYLYGTVAPSWVGNHVFLDKLRLLGNKRTEASGVAVFSGDGVTTQFTIAHGLVSTPSSVRVTPGSVDASGQFYITVDNTNIYVNYLSAPPSGTNNITLYWEAEV